MSDSTNERKVLATIYYGHSEYDDRLWNLLDGRGDTHLTGFDHAKLFTNFILSGADIIHEGKAIKVIINANGEERFYKALEKYLPSYLQDEQEYKKKEDRATEKEIRTTIEYYASEILNYMGAEEKGNSYYFAGDLVIHLLLQGKTITEIVNEHDEESTLKPYLEPFYNDLIKANVDIEPIIREIEKIEYKIPERLASEWDKKYNYQVTPLFNKIDRSKGVLANYLIQSIRSVKWDKKELTAENVLSELQTKAVDTTPIENEEGLLLLENAMNYYIEWEELRPEERTAIKYERAKRYIRI